MPSTRSSDPKPPKTHILDFFCDDDDGCAFTARINDQRFHIIVDPANLKSQGGEESSLLTEYLELLRQVRKSDEAEHPVEKEVDGGKETSTSEDRDSGVDISDEQEKPTAAKDTEEGQLDSPQSNPALDLQNWVLRCFGDEVPQHPDNEPKSKQQRSLLDWYETCINYYEVQPSADEQHLEPVNIEEQSTLKRRVDDLLPHLPLPKKQRSLPIPWIAATHVQVLAETDDPPPVHPSLVRAAIDGAEEQTYFFKPVDPGQPQPTKREIELLHKINTQGLADKFRVPKIEALVGWQDSNIETMGFLLTAIDDPVPLTKLLDSEVDESKRLKWAKETEKIIKTLHDNGIIWGDAKADNFLVDRHNQLWIIDFGGSFTEGWVDEDLKETWEGDDMGLERIVNGLKDPDGMTAEMDERSGGSGGECAKRKREYISDNGSEDAEEDNGGPRAKRSKA